MAAADAAYARLDRFGGIQQAGAAVGHADFWAQCFPLLAIIAPLAVLARPTVALLRRWRLAGAHLPPAVMTGLRRSLAEPGVTCAVLLATALAAGSFTLARLLTDSTSVLLSEKASTFLGSDLSITTRDIAGASSAVRLDRHRGHDGPRGTVAAVDRPARRRRCNVHACRALARRCVGQNTRRARHGGGTASQS